MFPPQQPQRFGGMQQFFSPQLLRMRAQGQVFAGNEGNEEEDPNSDGQAPPFSQLVQQDPFAAAKLQMMRPKYNSFRSGQGGYGAKGDELFGRNSMIRPRQSSLF